MTPPDDTPGPDLIGQVYSKDGKPLAGTVFIATAAPKTGSSVLCPSCYFDCTKRSKTDVAGAFKIESLDPQLTFQVLAVAKGYKPKSISKVDPAKELLKIELDPIESSDATPDRTLRGKVVDPDGKPVEGAVVNTEGIETRDGGGRFGTLPGVDPLAVTDEKGEFMITSREAFELMTVKVEARMFANRTFGQLPSGMTTNILRLTEGASVSGRVLHNGQPLSNIVMGISGKERSAGEYVGHFEVATGPEGKFLFVNLPAETDYVLYGTMDSLKGIGAIPARTVRSGKDGEKTSVGELSPVPGNRLVGKVALADGAALPAKTRMLLSREQAWDSLQIELSPDGSFDVRDLPSETFSLSIRVKDYHVSAQNRSLDSLNGRLLGRIDRDITNLVVRLDKGPDLEPNYNSTYEWPGSKPLRGAEGGVDHSDEWKISGRVLDATTKQPIAALRVTPGAETHRIDWDDRRMVEGTNGAFTVYVPKSFAAPQIKVEADGYLPASAVVPERETAEVRVELERGSGPAGVVLSPDGKPEPNATVVMVEQTYNQANLNSQGELQTHWNRRAMQRTDVSGKFSFKPQLGIKAIAASSPNGFAFVRLEDLAKDQALRLQPFGRISGTLTRGSGPVTNTMLDVGLPELSRFGITISTHSTTDAEGRFAFNRVPAGSVQIFSRAPVDGGNSRAWTQVPLKLIDLKPGQALETSLTASNQPAAQRAFQSSRQPELRRVEGEELKGVVLLPDGSPAADAEVAIRVQNRYLTIGKGKLNHGSREEYLFTHTEANGSFTLPLFKETFGVIAINSHGICEITLDEFKATSKIQLQSWGSLEGEVTVDGAPAVGEVLNVHSSGRKDNLTMLDPNAFAARTDEKGTFVMPMLPPGKYSITRRISRSEGSWTSHPVGKAEVKSGKVAQVELVFDGRKVTGRVTLPETISVTDFPQVQASLQTPSRHFFARLRDLKTMEEREAFQKEQETMRENFKTFPVMIRADGSFEADHVQPGKYELSLFIAPKVADQSGLPSSVTILLSKEQLEIPAGKTSSEPVNLGEVTVEKVEMPVL